MALGEYFFCNFVDENISVSWMMFYLVYIITIAVT